MPVPSLGLVATRSSFKEWPRINSQSERRKLKTVQYIMSNDGNDDVLALEFLSLQARLAAAAKDEWYLVQEDREAVLLLMKRCSWRRHKAVRVVLGYTQNQMADLFGIRLPSYQAIEDGPFKTCQWTLAWGYLPALSLDTASLPVFNDYVAVRNHSSKEDKIIR